MTSCIAENACLASLNNKRTPILSPALRPVLSCCYCVCLSCREQEELEGKTTVTPFVEELVRADTCAFVPGYFKYINETEATVLSILTFMPGMRVVVPAHERDFYVYQR